MALIIQHQPATNSTAGPSVIVVSSRQNEKTLKNAFVGVGCTQATLGIILLAFGLTIAIFLPLGFYYGTGLWGGLVYIITGVSGLAAGLSPGRCVLIFGLVMSIIGFHVALTCVTMDGLGAGFWGAVLTDRPDAQAVMVALFGVSAFLHAVHLVLCIVQIALFGKAISGDYGKKNVPSVAPAPPAPIYYQQHSPEMVYTGYTNTQPGQETLQYPQKS